MTSALSALRHQLCVTSCASPAAHQPLGVISRWEARDACLRSLVGGNGGAVPVARSLVSVAWSSLTKRGAL